MSIEEDSKYLSASGYPVELYTIDLTMLGGPILRLTPQSQGDGNGLRFGGQVYAAADIQGEGFEVSGKGTLPRPTVRITALVQSLTSLVQSLGDCVGGQITRTRTYSNYLDNGPTPDFTEKYPEDVFYIQQLTSMNKLFIEWQLSSVIDLQNRMVPRRRINRTYCDRIYRYWNGQAFDNTKADCPYAGGNYFDQFDNPTPDPAKDRCSKYLSGCKLRFGNSSLPTHIMPGAGRFSG